MDTFAILCSWPYQKSTLLAPDVCKYHALASPNNFLLLPFFASPQAWDQHALVHFTKLPFNSLLSDAPSKLLMVRNVFLPQSHLDPFSPTPSLGQSLLHFFHSALYAGSSGLPVTHTGDLWEVATKRDHYSLLAVWEAAQISIVFVRRLQMWVRWIDGLWVNPLHAMIDCGILIDK